MTGRGENKQAALGLLSQRKEKKQRETQMEEEMQKQTWPLPITPLLNHSIISRLNTQQLLVALLLCNGPRSKAARDMEIEEGERGECMFERNGRDEVNDKKEEGFLWISAEPELTSIWLMEEIHSGPFHLAISGWLGSSVSCFTCTHVGMETLFKIGFRWFLYNKH